MKGIEALEREIFGPVLHVATFMQARWIVFRSTRCERDRLRSDLRSAHADRRPRAGCGRDRSAAGNVYVNRNQIGAVVGSQPFGGEGLSGTGPKAGGPHYLPRFRRPQPGSAADTWNRPADMADLARRLAHSGADTRLSATILPGPTGELNRLSLARARTDPVVPGPRRHDRSRIR